MIIVWCLIQNYNYNENLITVLLMLYLITITSMTKIYKNVINFDIYVLKTVNKFIILLKYNNNFFKEGMYIDCLQKLSFDLWIKLFIFKSTQLFNLNYLNSYIIKFINNQVIVYFNYSLLIDDDLNLNKVLYNILLMFIISLQLVFIIYLNIILLS